MIAHQVRSARPANPDEPTSTALQRVQSEALLGNAGELLIVHKGREYRLRVTQNGKLILTA